MARFSINGVEYSGSVTRELVGMAISSGI